MPDPRTYQIDLPAAGRPTNITIPERWYPGVQNYWSRSTSARSIGDHINGIVAVVIHATAGASTAGAVSVMNPPPGRPAASFHWIVPDEDEPQHDDIIWACARERDAAWHVRPDKSHPQVNGGRNRVNHWSLGIEIVNRQNGGDSFSAWQVAITAQIVRYCWAKYPNLRHVVSHARLDPLRRTDPGANFPWNRFEQLVLGMQQDVLSDIDTDASRSASRNVIETKKTATIEDEEANFALEDEATVSSDLDPLHQAVDNPQ